MSVLTGSPIWNGEFSEGDFPSTSDEKLLSDNTGRDASDSLVHNRAILSASDSPELDFRDPEFGDPDFGDPDFGDPDFGDPDFGDLDFDDLESESLSVSAGEKYTSESGDASRLSGSSVANCVLPCTGLEEATVDGTVV